MTGNFDDMCRAIKQRRDAVSRLQRELALLERAASIIDATLATDKALPAPEDEDGPR